MAFPETSVLDDFDRSDGDLGANWTQAARASDDFSVSSNACVPDSSGALCEDYYNVADYGPDCEVYGTLTDAGKFFSLNARMADEDTSSPDSYYVQVRGSENELRIYRMDDGSDVLLGSPISQTTTDGDKAGLLCSGDQITAYFKDGAASWGSIGSRTDSTYDAAGKLAITAWQVETLILDDFGGGTVGGAEALSIGISGDNVSYWVSGPVVVGSG